MGWVLESGPWHAQNVVAVPCRCEIRYHHGLSGEFGPSACPASGPPSSLALGLSSLSSSPPHAVSSPLPADKLSCCSLDLS